MDRVFIVSNLKSYKTESEAREWLESFKKIQQFQKGLGDKEIIVCPSFTTLFLFKAFIKENNLPVKIGAQNISPFDEGAYTGEVNAKQVRDFADYVLIGHSERRTNFGEKEDVLTKKVDLSLKYGLIPIFLIQDENTAVPKGVELIAYEPVFAIGSGNPDTPESANSVASFVKLKNKDYKILYGGSVTFDNVRAFTGKSEISGVLVGGASLNPDDFIQIIQNA